jgi:hypothetical protein
MKQPRGNQYRACLRVLDRYYRALVAQAAEEVLEKRDQFAVPLLGEGESVLEKYARALQDFAQVYHALKAQGEALYQRKLAHLKPGQYLCFRCRRVIRKEGFACPHCGWSWEGRGRAAAPLIGALTEAARWALEAAGGHARRLRRAAVEPEHVLLALAEQGRGVAAQVLAGLGLDFATLAARVGGPSPAAEPPPGGRPLPHSGATEQLLADAWAECRQREQGPLNTGHLLLAAAGLIGEQGARVAELLRIDLKALRLQVSACIETEM